MTNSRRKGAEAELEAAKAMAEHLSVEARRGRQFQGGPESPDVKHSIPGVHVEVKRTEALRLTEALEQVDAEKDPCDIGVILHRKNRGPWLVILKLEDVKDFVCSLDAAWSKPQETA